VSCGVLPYSVIGTLGGSAGVSVTGATIGAFAASNASANPARSREALDASTPKIREVQKNAAAQNAVAFVNALAVPCETSE